MKAIAIVGSGFEGLLAAHVVSLSGNAVALFDVADDWQWLEMFERGLPHDAVITKHLPEVAEPMRGQMFIDILGDEKTYKQKAWPSVLTPERKVSILENGTVAYSAAQMYERLKDFYQVNPMNVFANVNHEILDRLVSESNIAEVICTLPKSLFCKMITDEFAAPCTFNHSVGYWSDQMIFPTTSDPAIVYNALTDQSWIKQGTLFGRQFTEWATKHPYIDTKPFLRPVSNNCNCNPDVHFVGRAGKWEGLDVPYDRVLTDVMGIVA